MRVRTRVNHAEGACIIRAMDDGAGMPALTLQMLEWIGERPRSYAETLEAWKTSCPRLTVWEDAVSGGLVRVQRGAVVLTTVGRERLETS
jgi:hypothetical protein